MNDLIRQFAIDCAGQLEWDFPKDPKSYTFTPDEVTRFAQQVIQECMNELYKKDLWHMGISVALVDLFKEQ